MCWVSSIIGIGEIGDHSFGVGVWGERLRDFVSVDVGVVVSCMIDGVGVGGLAIVTFIWSYFLLSVKCIFVHCNTLLHPMVIISVLCFVGLEFARCNFFPSGS